MRCACCAAISSTWPAPRIDVKLSALIMERVLGMRLEDRPASVGSFAANLRSFESVRDFIASATVTALIDLPFALLFLLVIAWISWPLVFIPMLGGIAVLIYSYVIQHKMHELSETTYRAAALRNATLIESLTALETIKAHGAEGLMQAQVGEDRRLPGARQRAAAAAVLLGHERRRHPAAVRQSCHGHRRRLPDPRRAC